MNELEISPDLPSLQDVIAISDIPTLQLFLTKQMASQRIQSLIRGSGLKSLAEHILKLAAADSSIELAAGATLSRLAAVARSREHEIFELLPSLFSIRPPGLDSLSNGDDKAYGAVAVGHSKGEWLIDYCISDVGARPIFLRCARRANTQGIQPVLND